MVNVRSRRRSTLARRGAGALGVGLLGALGILAASPAEAAVNGTINTPADGSSYSAYQKLDVDGTVTYANGDSGTATITATDPDNSGSSATGCAFQVASASFTGSPADAHATDVTGPLDLSAAYPKTCPAAFVGKPAVNGRWKLTLAASGSSVDSFFIAAVPPAAPSGVKASSVAPLSVTLAWTPNPELDTHAYAVVDAQGDVVSGPVNATGACSGSSCSASFSVADSGSQSFAVRAYRYVAPPDRPTSATAGDLTAESDDVTVDVAAGPAASPSAAASPVPGGSSSSPATGATPGAASGTAPPAGSSGAGSSARSGSAGGTTGSGGGNQPAVGGERLTLTGTKASGGEAAKIAAQFHDFAAPIGVGKLPPLPKLDSTGAGTDVPSAAPADGEPTDQGTFKLSLGYAPQSTLVATRTSSPGTPLTFVADAVGISPSALWRSLAGSLVLIICAGHLRRWARRPVE